ncbi:unnamed protein product [Cyprideis torosa]|uniref:Sodium/hydrogen exchanger n=1 Tax=Cyprideis torosa TaxID=163714 RepID=A0A7R8ZJM9_9CRUS|nr:unnamed protein product [Cyprideis torosa]CAG0879943.1 unnamed protein product [Cyprideis torosa]
MDPVGFHQASVKEELDFSMQGTRTLMVMLNSCACCFWILSVLWEANSVASDSVVPNDTSDLEADYEDYNESTKHSVEMHSGNQHGGVHLISWRWDEIQTPFTITVFIVLAGLAKLGGVVTESQEALPHFTPHVFFFYLLPPIVLESAYSLHDRAFFDNLGTIILYAVLGTVINAFAIGGCLYGLSLVAEYVGLPEGLRGVDIFVFSTIVSAVDPVSVLAIFQEIAVNKNIYFLVFGESLLNDAVVVVMYSTLSTLAAMPVVPVDQYVLGVVSFFTISLGGIFTGLIFGVVSALLTKHTQKVRVVEPLAVLGMAYLSYLSAELVHFSGIIAIIVCGLLQAQYALPNISKKSYTTVKYFTKMMGSVNDAIIFLFLGMRLINDVHDWNIGFVGWTLVFCLIFRFFSVFSLTALMNRRRIRTVDCREQFVMAYGGLRGAVGFSLVASLDESIFEHKQLFVTTLLVVIMFTVSADGNVSTEKTGIQYSTVGATIKPLLKVLDIKREEKAKKSLSQEINHNVCLRSTLVITVMQTLMDHVMAGVEEIVGKHGNFYLKVNYFQGRSTVQTTSCVMYLSLQQLLEYYEERYLRPLFINSQTETDLTRLYVKLALNDHYANLYGPAALLEEKQRLDFIRRSVAADSFGEVKEGQEFDEELFPKSPPRTMPSSPAPSKAPSVASVEPVAPPRRRSTLSNLPQFLRRFSQAPDTMQETLKKFAAKQAPVADERDVLRQAFISNPYNMLHQKHNPNLVDEDLQEMDSHLRRRRNNARRMSSFAHANITPKTSRHGSLKSGAITPRDTAVSEKSTVPISLTPRYAKGLLNPDVEELIHRAERRRINAPKAAATRRASAYVLGSKLPADILGHLERGHARRSLRDHHEFVPPNLGIIDESSEEKAKRCPPKDEQISHTVSELPIKSVAEDEKPSRHHQPMRRAMSAFENPTLEIDENDLSITSRNRLLMARGMVPIAEATEKDLEMEGISKPDESECGSSSSTIDVKDAATWKPHGSQSQGRIQEGGGGKGSQPPPKNSPGPTQRFEDFVY